MDAAAGRQQHDVALVRERAGLPHHQVHGTSVGALDVDDGDIRRVSGECLRDRGPVARR